MKTNRILVICTLFATLALMLFVGFAWYVTNPLVKATGFGGAVDGSGYSLDLERGTYDSETKTWTWTDTNSMAFSDIEPGNAFYFRVAVKPASGTTFPIEFSFSDIKTELISDTLAVKDGYVCYNQGTNYIPLYELDENNKYIIDGKVVFDCSDGTVKIKDYLLENVFFFYDYQTTAPTNNTIVASKKKGTIKDFGFVRTTVTQAGDWYYYFAIEFNEAASITSIDGGSSNAYQYQKVNIGSISVAQQQ